MVALTAKLALVDPAGTMIAGGTGNAELLLDNTTWAPPGPAGVASVTVHVASAFGATTPGVQAIEFEPEALSVKDAD